MEAPLMGHLCWFRFPDRNSGRVRSLLHKRWQGCSTRVAFVLRFLSFIVFSCEGNILAQLLKKVDWNVSSKLLRGDVVNHDQ